MKIYSRYFHLILIGLLFGSCQTKQRNDTADAKLDSAANYINDLSIEQLKISNAAFPDERVTKAIRAYTAAKTPAQKSDALKFIPIEMLPCGPDYTKKTRGGIVLASVLDNINPTDFDLAILNNNVVARQVKLLNRYYQDLDTSTLDAISFYEGLPDQEKKRLLFNNTPSPVPIFARQLLNHEFQRAYQLMKAQALLRLQKLLIDRKYMNEFPQGFKDRVNLSQTAPHATAFDLVYYKP